MNESYDVIVLGTGLTECILAGLLSAHGKRVLHIDRNNFYGGESASVNLNNLFKLFRPGQVPPEHYGPSREWNVDLVPKFTMANGKLVKVILHTVTVANNLEWKCVDGTYVMQVSKGGLFSSAHAQIHKVPATDTEALKSSLMGLWEKKRCKKFFSFASNYDPANRSTWGDMDLAHAPFSALVAKFSLEQNTVDFIGHAVALYEDESFISSPSHEILMKVKLYMDSAGLYGNSPFIYPVYGIGGIPEGFSRLCAIYGGVYMLDKPVDELLFDAEGKITGIRSGEETAQCRMLLCDPSYVLPIGKVRPTGKVVRAICVLNHPIPHTDNCQSCQIILPQRQTGRAHDIYVGVVSAAHCVCSNGFYLAICSTTVETATPEAELQPAFSLLGETIDTFVKVYDTYEPIADGRQDNVFVSKSFDATSHFETAVDDMLSLYERIMGEPLNYEEQLKPFVPQEPPATTAEPSTDTPAAESQEPPASSS